MSDYIEMTQEFSHADEVYPVKYRPGIYEVVARRPGQGEVSRRCAEVALETGAAVEFDKAAAEKAAAEKAAADKAAAKKAAAKKATGGSKDG